MKLLNVQKPLRPKCVRWALVIIFHWFGEQISKKFGDYEPPDLVFFRICRAMQNLFRWLKIQLCLLKNFPIISMIFSSYSINIISKQFTTHTLQLANFTFGL